MVCCFSTKVQRSYVYMSMLSFPINVSFSCIWQRRANSDLNSITRLLNLLKGKRGPEIIHRSMESMDDCGFDINPFAYFFFIAIRLLVLHSLGFIRISFQNVCHIDNPPSRWHILNQQDPELYQNMIANPGHVKRLDGIPESHLKDRQCPFSYIC